MSLDEVSTTQLAALVIALLSLVPTYLVYRRGSRADDAAQANTRQMQMSAERAQSQADHQQVYAGYGGLLQAVQDDNTDLRRRLAVAEEALREYDEAKEDEKGRGKK